MTRDRHVEDVLPPSARQRAGEECAQLFGHDVACTHEPVTAAGTPVRTCCHGGHGRHVAIPRHPVWWPSSSQAGLASFRSAR